MPDDEDESALGAAPTLPSGAEGPRPPRPGRSPSWPRQWPLGGRGTFIVAVLIVSILAVVIGSTFKKTPRNRIGISYGGGPLEGSHFQRVIAPGHGLFDNGFMDKLYLYPADQQNYIISKSTTQGGRRPDSVIAPSEDRVPIEYQVATYFRLDTDMLRAFHEQFGLQYKAYTATGWSNLIRDTFRQQIEASLQAETRKYNVADLYASASLLSNIQRAVQTSIAGHLRTALGEPFFCGPTWHPGGTCSDPVFVIKKVDIPNSVARAYQDNRTSQVQVQTKQNEVAQRTAEAQAINALNGALSQAGINYVLLRAIESGKINFWVIPNGSGVTLQTPPTSAPKG